MYVFDCKSYDAYRLEQKLTNYFILGENKKAYEVLEKLKRKIDIENKLNKQYLGHVETTILNNLGEISNEETIEKYIEALEITIPIKSVFSDTKKYFTKREIMLIYKIGMIYNDNEDYKNAIKWLGIFEKYYKNSKKIPDSRMMKYNT